MSPPVAIAAWTGPGCSPNAPLVPLRVGEVRDAIELVLLQHTEVHRRDGDRDAQQPEDDEVPTAGAGHRQHHERDEHEHQVRPEVRLQQDEPDRHPGQRHHEGGATSRSPRYWLQYPASATMIPNLASSPGWSCSGRAMEPRLRALDLRPPMPAPRRAGARSPRRQHRVVAEAAVVDQRTTTIATKPSTSRTASGASRSSTGRRGCAVGRRIDHQQTEDGDGARGAEQQPVEVAQRRRLEPGRLAESAPRDWARAMRLGLIVDISCSLRCRRPARRRRRRGRQSGC